MLSDFHVHSKFSADSDENLENIINKAISLNMKDICITDHQDWYWPVPGESFDIDTDSYFNELNIDEKNPKWEDRDRMILSKGHCSPALYSCLANRGFFDKEELKKFRNINSRLQGHPDMNKVPGVDMTTGSLGQGLSVANGMAIAGKLNKKDYRVYCVLGDGEIEEGQIWEAAMTSNKYKLDNLCVIVDNNNLQIDGTIEEVMSSYPIEEKFRSFGFKIININGHDIQ